MKNLITTVTKDGQLKLLKDFRVLSIVIPKGFKTDGASIPWFLQFVGSPFEGDSLRAALVHDALYQNKGKIGKVHVNRVTVDVIFFHLLCLYGMNTFKAFLYYSAVRMFGWFPWYCKRYEVIHRLKMV